MSVFQGPRNTRFFERGRSVSSKNVTAEDSAAAQNGTEKEMKNSAPVVEIEILEPKRPPDEKTKKRLQEGYEQLQSRHQQQSAVEADNLPP